MSPAEDPAVEHDVQRTILVVEDEVLPRLAISEYLRGCGFHVVEAADGAEAQQLLLTGLEVDLVFSDISMPGEIDGVALAAWIGANNIPTEIILTSGLASALASARAACAHVKGFVSKPYDYQLVADRIRTMLTA